MGEGLVERVARKLSWPDEEETKRGLALYRAEYARIMGRIRNCMSELQDLADRFPEIEKVVVPDEIAALLPGANIEVVVWDDDVLITSDSIYTNPLLALIKETAYELGQVAEVLDAWERTVEEVEDYTAERAEKILGAAPAKTLEAMEAHLDAMARPHFKIAPRHGYSESAGLRQTLLAYLPHEVGDGLSRVVAYLYDQALEVGDAPGPAGYIEQEFRARGEDLAYLAERFRVLADVSPHMTVAGDDRGRLEAAEKLATTLQGALDFLGERHA